MTPEIRVKNDIMFYLSVLRRRGLLDFWPQNNMGVFDQAKGIYRRNKSQFFRKGVPDIMVILKGGRFLGIEVKAPKGVLSREQKLFGISITEMGALYVVARSVAEVANVLTQHLNSDVLKTQ